MKNDKPRSRGRPRTLDREQALDTALQLFWRHGYEGTSIADLTRAMGVTPPSLYAAFGTKEQLYREALDRYVAAFETFADQTLGAEPTGYGAFKRLLSEAALFYSQGALGCMLVSGVLVCSEEHQTIAADVSARRQGVIQTLKLRLDRATLDGELSIDTDTLGLASFFCAVLQGTAIQARDGAMPATLNIIVDNAMRAWPTAPPT